MFKIQTFSTIAPIGLNQFPRESYEVASDILHPDAILVRSHILHDMTIPSSVKAIGRAGAGVNNIPVEKLTKKGVVVFNTPGANANAVREIVVASMLIASRNIIAAHDYVRQLKCSSEQLVAAVEAQKKQFVGSELLGKTLGIIGLGNIGVKVANAAIGLGMNVIGYDPSISVNRAWELSSSVNQAHGIDELLMESDFVSFHVPLIDATKQMINESRLQIMKPGVVLLNFSRDGVFAKEALIEAMNSKKVMHYITDFPCAVLKDHPRVISLPHIGASTKEAEQNCAVMVVKQIRQFLEQGVIVNSVNFPSLMAANLQSGTRLAVVNANIPNMVAQISSALARSKLNITSLINQSLNDIAYTLIDTDHQVSDTICSHIAKIAGVIQVRRIAVKK
jgi:D-3-phosphoglycerate dehydrogenase / 2-oxoglutarate reductase